MTGRYLLAGIPAFMLTFAVLGVNLVHGTVFGYPALPVWIIGWVVVTPAFLYAADRLRRNA
jgi:hypothetical protein